MKKNIYLYRGLIMARYSDTVETNGRTVRYNYDKNVVEWFCPATEEELKKDAEFRAKNPTMHHGLYIMDENKNIVMKSIRCDSDEWEDMSIREELLQEFNRMVDESAAFLNSFVSHKDSAQ